MITVRIPQEIRKYKEKVIFGLTSRQLKAVLASFVIGSITYFLSKERISTDMLIWAIIFEAMPVLAIGFVGINGMPLDKWLAVWFRLNFIHPRKRVFKSEVAYREWELDSDYISGPTGMREKAAYKKWRKQASLERAALIEEAMEKGDARFDAMGAALMTVAPDPAKEKLEKILKSIGKGAKNYGQ